ncbi:NACHT domain-containing protein [Micromonospora sp. DT47]|uniref:NACHT domain-containing protein n=1 Tax=Micromonospora sp. DT47 TaxID=3393431 RepID=UPI003CF7127E
MLIQGVRTELLAAIDDAGTEALIKIERLLSVARPPATTNSLARRSVVYRANRGALSEPIVSHGAIHGASEINFPSVEQIYVEPRYRHCVSGNDAYIASEDWWETQKVQANIAVYLTAHITSHQATTAPLLILGHPGAGKSLLTKVLSARLPESGYTAIRVPLRRVRSDRLVYEQIQEALDEVTNGRVRWADLAEESRGSVRVVFLDGLDELLQASPGSHRTFFREIAEFQRNEANQGLPVVVIVTSRTIVADQVELPAGTPVLKLEDFSGAQIRTWLNVWKTCNSQSISLGQMRHLEPQTAIRQLELARQPLILLMLAVYAADPTSEPLTDKLSTASLYRQLLRNFATREVLKTDPRLSGSGLAEKVEDHLWTLTIAAFGMFNRGRQYVSDYQLGADLGAFDDSYFAQDSREEELGRHVAAQFFFIHAAEARVAGGVQPARSYEFLHATFGEYLVAQQTMTMLVDLERSDRTRGARDRDGLLFALLSCQVLVGRMSILELISQLATELGEAEVENIASRIDDILRNYALRPTFDGYSGYKAMPPNRVVALAVYSLNMIAIRIAISRARNLDISDIWGERPEASLRHWQEMVKHWAAALDAGSWAAATSSLELFKNNVRFMPRMRLLSGTNFRDILYARLLGDKELEANLRIGVAIRRKSYYYMSDDDWEAAALASLYSVLHSRGRLAEPIMPLPPPSVGRDAVRRVGIAIARVLKYCDTAELPMVAKPLVKLLFALPGVTPDPYALALSLLADPTLAKEIPELLNPDHYASGGWGLWFLFANDEGMDEEIRALRASLRERIPSAPDGNFVGLKEAVVMLRQLLRSFRPRFIGDAKGVQWSRQKLSGGSYLHFNRAGAAAWDKESREVDLFSESFDLASDPPSSTMPRPRRRIRS